MKNPMTSNVLVAGCPAAAVRSDRRAVNRIAPVFADGTGQDSVLRVTGVTLLCSGNAPGSPPD